MNLIQRAKSHALIAALRLQTTDPEVFTVLQSIAKSDGAFVAREMMPTLAKVAGSAEAEAVLESGLERYVQDRTQGFRRDGADEAATTAYSLAFVMAFDDAGKEFAASMEQTQAKTPSGLPATR